MSRAHDGWRFAKIQLAASYERVRQGVKTFQVHAIRSDDHVLGRQTHVKVLLQKLNECAGNGDESLAPTYDKKSTMPNGTEYARRLNMNFKNSGNPAQQSKNRRLWKPCIQDIRP